MVIDRSELSRSRAGIHGGIRRGASAAAVGVVLVLSAGVPSSQAFDGGLLPAGPVQAARDDSLGDGLLTDLLGDAGAAVTVTPAPAPSSAGTPTPGTAPSAGTSAGQVAQSTVPAPEASAPPSPASSPAPVGGPTSGGGPATADSGRPDTEIPVQPGSGRNAEQQPATRPSSGSPGASPAPTPASGLPTPAGTPARQALASAQSADMAAGPARVWLGVGLVGSAGAAGLVFARIRRL